MVCPADGQIHLWAAHLDKIDFDRSYLQSLSQDERDRAEADLDGMGRVLFTPGEKRALDLMPESERVEAFFRCWTRKEAYVKARGEGLSLPLDSFEISLAPDTQTLVVTAPDDGAC